MSPSFRRRRRTIITDETESKPRLQKVTNIQSPKQSKVIVIPRSQIQNASNAKEQAFNLNLSNEDIINALPTASLNSQDMNEKMPKAFLNKDTFNSMLQTTQTTLASPLHRRYSILPSSPTNAIEDSVDSSGHKLLQNNFLSQDQPKTTQMMSCLSDRR